MNRHDAGPPVPVDPYQRVRESEIMNQPAEQALCPDSQPEHGRSMQNQTIPLQWHSQGHEIVITNDIALADDRRTLDDDTNTVQRIVEHPGHDHPVSEGDRNLTRFLVVSELSLVPFNHAVFLPLGISIAVKKTRLISEERDADQQQKTINAQKTPTECRKECGVKDRT